MKNRTDKLMRAADCAIKATIVKDNIINESYNGQTAALGVTIVMSGLMPALAIYYQDEGTGEFSKRKILDAVAHMLSHADAKALFQFALKSDTDLKALKREILDCSVALKQVIRTYKLKKNGK